MSWTFMQDVAPCHRSHLVKDWLHDHSIRLLEWPAYSPDLNPIENLWVVLVRRFYANMRQFDDEESLTECILEAWDDIGRETLDKLVRSMTKRCVNVVQAKGKKIDY